VWLLFHDVAHGAGHDRPALSKWQMSQSYLAEPDVDDEQARTLRPLQAAAITYRIAFGPRAGQKC
jgi:hypothetical protein